MARGKGLTTKPVNIAVHTQWMASPAILKLIEDGHNVRRYGSFNEDDVQLIIHPAAGWDAALLEPEEKKDKTKYWPYVDGAITKARGRMKEGKK